MSRTSRLIQGCFFSRAPVVILHHEDTRWAKRFLESAIRDVADVWSSPASVDR